MDTIIGTLISARITPPLSTVSPIGAPVSCMMSGLITVRPMKPHTTDGIAASSSMVILRTSFHRGPQNSETNTAAPSPKGTAKAMARAVTLAVPAMSASTP